MFDELNIKDILPGDVAVGVTEELINVYLVLSKAFFLTRTGESVYRITWAIGGQNGLFIHTSTYFNSDALLKFDKIIQYGGKG
jgi:hypothetical protein